MKTNWGAIGALATGVLIFVAVLLIVFVVNPKNSQQGIQITVQERQLRQNQERLYRFICAQAQTSANAFRFRQATPNEVLETVSHFLTRMLAQREVLELSKGLGCESTPGFPPFNYQVKQALAQIERILSRFSPELKQQAATALGIEPLPSLPIGEPGKMPVNPSEQTGIKGHAPEPKGDSPEHPPFQVPREDGPPLASAPPTEEPRKAPVPEELLPPAIPPLPIEDCVQIHSALSACASVYEEGRTNVQVETGP